MVGAFKRWDAPANLGGSMGSMGDRFWKAFEGVRRITVFLLGVIVVIFALIDPESANTVVMLIIGMVMVGILPVENVLSWFRPRRERRNDAINDR